MNTPVRTTIAFGLVSALLVLPLGWLLQGRLGWLPAFKITLWADMTVYALLLVRWSQARSVEIIFPIMLVLGAALWPRSFGAFFFLALGVFSWIRSGICFKKAPLRALSAELLTCLGGAGLVRFWEPHSAIGWSLGLWLFFLVQTLYFFLIPASVKRAAENSPPDLFEQVRRDLEKVLNQA
jgi:hypothetical protein